MLYLISVLIGNLLDVSKRAVETLEKVEILLCEDTRVTGKLLGLLGIKNKPKLVSFYDQVEKEKAGQVIEWLKEGKEVGLVGDAGTPLLSDPGWYLTRECIKQNLEIEVVPGASAVVTALQLSGLPMDKYSFLGFLPKKGGKRKRVLEKYGPVLGTKVFYESPFRVGKLLGDVLETWGDLDVALCREMTKKHQEVIRGKASEVLEKIRNRVLKGEVVLVVG